MSVTLYSDLNNNGRHFDFSTDTPHMPPDWDARSLSCIISPWDRPWFFSEPNYQGQALHITKGGGCNDLDRLPGGWRNKIRSINYSMSANICAADLTRPETLAEMATPRAQEFLSSFTNPSIADAGCIFPGGLRTAAFRYSVGCPQIGQRLSIVVLTPQFQMNCPGGRPAQYEDLSMTLTECTVAVGDPFAQMYLTGYA
jgi:hypothetical protein